MSQKKNNTEESKDFDLIITDLEADALIKIDPSTGVQSILSQNGRFQSGPTDLVIDEDGMIYTTVFDVPGSPPEIVMVDPVSGTQTTISSGNYLKTSISGITIDNNGDLLVTKGTVQNDVIPRLLRINKITGEQTVLSQGGKFKDLNDVIVSAKGEIYVLGDGVLVNTNYIVPTLFKIEPISGDQIVVFQSEGYILSEIAFLKDGSIIAGGNVILRIWPITSQYQEIVSTAESGRYNGIAVSENSEVFVTRIMCCPRSNPTVCRLDLNNATLNSFSHGQHLINPYGMAIRNR